MFSLDHRREITGMVGSVVDERFSTRGAVERVDLWTLNLLSRSIVATRNRVAIIRYGE